MGRQSAVSESESQPSPRRLSTRNKAVREARVLASASRVEVSTNGVCIINERAVGVLPPRGKVLQEVHPLGIACVRSAAGERALTPLMPTILNYSAATRLPLLV